MPIVRKADRRCMNDHKTVCAVRFHDDWLLNIGSGKYERLDLFALGNEPEQSANELGGLFFDTAATPLPYAPVNHLFREVLVAFVVLVKIPAFADVLLEEIVALFRPEKLREFRLERSHREPMVSLVEEILEFFADRLEKIVYSLDRKS